MNDQPNTNINEDFLGNNMLRQGCGKSPFVAGCQDGMNSKEGKAGVPTTAECLISLDTVWQAGNTAASEVHTQEETHRPGTRPARVISKHVTSELFIIRFYKLDSSQVQVTGQISGASATQAQGVISVRSIHIY